MSMKIQLPNGKSKILDESRDIEYKKRLAFNLSKGFAEVIVANWESKTIRFFLEGISNYLVWHKEEDMKGKQDKEVISLEKEKQISGKKKSPSLPFSSLSHMQKEILGLDEVKQ